jgi:hypothetical protein
MPDARYETDGDFRYIVFEGKACVTDYLGTQSKIEIPSMLGGYPVTTITGCFSFPETVTDITVAEGVLTIEPYALVSRGAGSGMILRLPDSIRKIYPDGLCVFSGGQPITVYAPEGSAARRFVLDLGEENITCGR